MLTITVDQLINFEKSAPSARRMPESERRVDARIQMPYPVIVRGTDCSGEPFEENTHVDDLSAGGLGLKLSHRVLPGSNLFFVFHLSLDGAPAPRVAARGTVRRVQLTNSSYCDQVGVQFRHHRFLLHSPHVSPMSSSENLEVLNGVHPDAYAPSTFEKGDVTYSALRDASFSPAKIGGISGGDSYTSSKK
jgi:hypothetical protein